MKQIMAIFAALLLTGSVFADNESPSKEPQTRESTPSPSDFRDAGELVSLPAKTIIALNGARFLPGIAEAGLGTLCAIERENVENDAGLIYRSPLVLEVTNAGYDDGHIEIAFNSQTSRGVTSLRCRLDDDQGHRVTIGEFIRQIEKVNGAVKLPPVAFR